MPLLLILLACRTDTILIGIVVKHRRVQFDVLSVIRLGPKNAQFCINKMIEFYELRLHMLHLISKLVDATKVAQVVTDRKLCHI